MKKAAACLGKTAAGVIAEAAAEAAQATIYIMLETNGNVYVGRTKQALKARLAQHAGSQNYRHVAQKVYSFSVSNIKDKRVVKQLEQFFLSGVKRSKFIPSNVIRASRVNLKC